MAIVCQDLKPLRMYSSTRKLYLPFNEENKKKGSAVFLLTPNAASSQKVMNLPYLINKKTSSLTIWKGIVHILSIMKTISSSSMIMSLFLLWKLSMMLLGI